MLATRPSTAGIAEKAWVKQGNPKENFLAYY
jgi:hypothetical protein